MDNKFDEEEKELYRHIVIRNLELIESRKESAKVGRNDDSPAECTEEYRESGKVESEVAKERSRLLFVSLVRLMEDARIYRDPLLTRETVLSRLNTNSTYLTQAIKQHSGKNYSQFINGYRIDEAVEILSDRSKTDIPIKTVCAEVGFNSVATFYKIFQNIVGISPAAYRKSLLNITHSEDADVD